MAGRESETKSVLQYKWYLKNTALAGVAGIVAVALCASRSGVKTFLCTLGLAAVVALAAFWVIGLVGFLFGLPPSRPEDNANQSLEEVAEWLTKLIIGAGLVELKSLSSFVGDLGRSASSQAGLESGSVLFTSLILLEAAAGFVFFYFWAYMYWGRLKDQQAMRAIDVFVELHANGVIDEAEYRRRINRELRAVQSNPAVSAARRNAQAAQRAAEAAAAEAAKVADDDAERPDDPGIGI